MQKCKLKEIFTMENTIVLTILITSILLIIISPETAQATVESSIKGVGASFQKLALGCGVIGFTLGGLGMMFGAQWGMRTIVGSMLGTACILGGNSMISFFSAQIR
jgi:hypothetical protein